jgi:hypothetical protein
MGAVCGVFRAATAVSVARFGGRRHSASDALAGAAMGFFIGDFVYRHHHAPSEKSKIAMWLVDHVNLQFGGRIRCKTIAYMRCKVFGCRDFSLLSLVRS